MCHEKVGVLGRLVLEVMAPDGRVICRRREQNTVLDGGRRLLALLLGDLATGPRFAVTVGTDTTTETKPDMTKLVAPGTIKSVPVKRTSVNNATVILHATFAEFADPETTIGEAGLLVTVKRRAPGDTEFTTEETLLYNRVRVLGEKLTVQKGETLDLTWELSFAAGPVGEREG